MYKGINDLHLGGLQNRQDFLIDKINVSSFTHFLPHKKKKNISRDERGLSENSPVPISP